MGHPKKQRRTYDRPSHPWQRERIEIERDIKKKYGLKNKKEIWRIGSLLKKFKNQTKRIIAGAQVIGSEEQVKKEEEQLMDRLHRLGIMDKSAKIELVLDLTQESIMDRRLQTIVFNKGFARTIDQARQFVVHKHVMIGEQCVNIPSYLVKKEEENKIRFVETSPLKDNEHPERVVVEKKEKSKAVTVVRKETGKVETEKVKTEEKPEPTPKPAEEEPTEELREKEVIA